MPTKDSSDKVEKYRFLLDEARKWTSIGIISREQLQKIYSLYKDPQKAVEAKHFNMVSIIAIFGSLLIGAGIIFFFAMNWPTIPKLVKVVSILASLVASCHIGYTMKFSKANFPSVGGALIFLGAIIFGAGIFLIGQIFNINSHWPNAFLYWTLGIVAFAYLTQSKPIMYLSLLTASIYVGSETSYWFNFLDRYYNISYAFFLIFLSLGITYYMLGNLHEKKDSVRMLRYPFHLVGSFLIMLVAYLFSFKWFGRMDNYGYSTGASATSVLFSSKFWIIYLAVTLIAVVFTFISFKYRDTKDSTEFHEVIYLGLLLVFTPLVVLFSKINFWLIPITFNIVLFLLIVGSVYLGYAKREKTLVNLGMIAFGVAVFSRYIEYLWDVLNGYLFFIIGGVLLIVLAIILEKNRRKIIDRFTG